MQQRDQLDLALYLDAAVAGLNGADCSRLYGRCSDLEAFQNAMAMAND